MMLDAKHCDHRQTLENGEAGSAFRIRVIGLVLDDTAVHQSRARRSSARRRARSLEARGLIQEGVWQTVTLLRRKDSRRCGALSIATHYKSNLLFNARSALERVILDRTEQRADPAACSFLGAGALQRSSRALPSSARGAPAEHTLVATAP